MNNPTTNITTYNYATVRGRKMFYRQAGNKDAPTIVLLHGFSSSSHMFRDLIPKLSDRFHVIAPDYIGFGSILEIHFGLRSLTFPSLLAVLAIPLSESWTASL